MNMVFGAWWSGGPLSYLRFMTFESLRRYNPDAEIHLFVNDKFSKDQHEWNVERQDFESPVDGIDYLEELENGDVEVHHVDWFSTYPPNYQSDFFRWWFLHERGGFYFDLDQIFLRPFDELPDLDVVEFYYSAYQAATCGWYTPVGLIGANKGLEITKVAMEVLPQVIRLDNYNSAGPFMFRELIRLKEWPMHACNMGHAFYSAPESIYVPQIYCGNFMPHDTDFALHWYGGHPESQDFNKRFNKEFAKTSEDSISKILRQREII